MLYKNAKKLHNHDEVTIKSSKEIVEVINTEIFTKDIFVYAMTNDGYQKLHHKEIK